MLRSTQVKYLSATTPSLDIAGNMFSENGQLTLYSSSDVPKLSSWFQTAVSSNVTILFDAVFRNLDEEYLDSKALDTLLNL